MLRSGLDSSIPNHHNSHMVNPHTMNHRKNGFGMEISFFAVCLPFHLPTLRSVGRESCKPFRGIP